MSNKGLRAVQLRNEQAQVCNVNVIDDAALLNTQPEDRMITDISDYVYYVYNNVYEYLRMKPLVDRIGGHMVTWGKPAVFKGVLMFTKYFEVMPKPKEYERVYVGHGTSNKLQRDFFGFIGKTHLDHYFLSGPKYRWYLKKKGHRPMWKKSVKIGDITHDPYWNGEWNREYALEKLKLKGDKPIVLIGSTYGSMGINRIVAELPKIRDEFDVVATKHPLDNWGPETYKYLEGCTLYNGPAHEILWVADVLINDVSSIIYDYVITGKPILLVKPVKDNSYWEPSWTHYDIRRVAPTMIPGMHDLVSSIKAAQKIPKETLLKLAKNVFYYNDGKAVDRAEAWIRNKVKRYMKTMRVYRNK